MLFKTFYIFLVFQLLILQNFSTAQTENFRHTITDSLVNDEPDNLDIKIFRSINNLRNPFLDNIIHYSDIACIPICLSTPLIMLTISKLNDNYYNESSAALLTLSEFSTITTTFILKDLVKRERPFRKLKNVKHSKKDEMFLDPYSFPSGHSALSFCLATSLSLRYSDKTFLIASLYTYSTLVAFGRVYIGVHYPSDVLAGMIIGTGSAILVHSMRKELIGNYDKNYTNNNQNLKNSSGTLIFLSFFITEGINYILNKNEINSSSQLLLDGKEKYFKFSLSF